MKRFQEKYNPSLIGRATQLEQLHLIIDEGLTDRIQTIVIKGEAGIGKTNLAHDFTNQAQEKGWLVLKGHAWNMGKGLAFAPIIEAFRSELEQYTPKKRSTLAMEYPYLNVLFPSLGGPLPIPLAQASLERTRLFESLRLFTLSLSAQRSVIFWIDDLPEADLDTLEWIQYCIQYTKEEGRLVILSTSRSSLSSEYEPYNQLEKYLAHHKLLKTIELSALSISESNELIRTKLSGKVEDRTLSAISAHTGGVPLYIIEMVTNLELSGGIYNHDGSWDLDKGAEKLVPLSITSLLEERLNALSANEWDLLLLFIASKQFIPWGVLQKASITKDLSDHVSGLLKKGIIKEEIVIDDIVYTLSHPMLKDVAVPKFQLLEIRQAHYTLANAWYNQDIIYAARHMLETGTMFDGLLSANILYKAGERYLTLRSYEKAVEYLEKAKQTLQAIDSSDNSELQFSVSLMLSEALTYVDKPHQALVLLNQLFQETFEDPIKIRIKRLMAWVESTRSFEECMRHILEGLDLWDGETESADILWMMNEMVFNDLNAGQISQANKSILSLKEYVMKFPSPHGELLWRNREAHFSLMSLDRSPVSLEKANTMLADARMLREPELIYDVYCLFGYVALNQGDFNKAIKYTKECVELVRQNGMVIHEISIRLVGMNAYFMQGDWNKSLLEAEAIENLARDYEVYAAVICTLDLRALILVLQGKEAEGHLLVLESLKLTHEVFLEGGAHQSKSALHVIDAVEAITQEYLEDTSVGSKIVYWGNAHGMQIFLKLIEGLWLVKVGLVEKAEELLVQLYQGTPEKEPNYVNGVSHLLAGLLRYQNGEIDVARDHLNRSINCFEILRTPLELAIARAIVSDTYETSEATTINEQSIKEFRTLGASVFEKWASHKNLFNEKFSEGDSGSGQTEFPLVESLTKREVEILEAIASGLSNKDIAIKFRITEGTVKNHLFNLYGKLGVNKRIQSVLVAREHGIIE
ncbi:helix-turn-helix transcriptional regulator [Paenisporosarcina sp. TG20]|uniref:helix-turn-helix transcriptional regulator n=1 Tax=Paenisporosarcina sp. TG20 TaxID=1211706 RepID=UPI0002ECD4F1|nr:helix-turn-helix transcriptional regulator [Paenisporosarcina sp. TG20]